MTGDHAAATTVSSADAARAHREMACRQRVRTHSRGREDRRGDFDLQGIDIRSLGLLGSGIGTAVSSAAW